MFSQHSSTKIHTTNDQEKLNVLTKYAPLVYLAKEETFFPSSVEWSFPYLERYKDSSGKYSLRSKETIACPEQILPFFHGDYKNLQSVPAYAFWVDKKDNITDLIYFLWYPYNRGKAINLPPAAKGFYGNHVGDWERVTVRLKSNTKQPQTVFFSQHGGGGEISWDKAEKNGTHPISYSAQGSHANYPTPGDHKYLEAVAFRLVDLASKGYEWNTWNNLKAYDYNNKKGLNTDWPYWMWTCYDYTVPGLNASLPSSGPIYRWGDDAKRDCIPGVGECLLSNGPTGPPAKGAAWENALGSTDSCPKG